MNIEIIICVVVLLLYYAIYYLSTILHEFSHKRYFKKYGIPILKNRGEVIDANLEKELSRFSLFASGVEWKLAGAIVHVKNEDFEKKENILMAGIKADFLYFSIIFLVGFVLFSLDYVADLYLKISFYGILRSIEFLVVALAITFIIKTKKNLFDKKSDFQVLLNEKK